MEHCYFGGALEMTQLSSGELEDGEVGGERDRLSLNEVLVLGNPLCAPRNLIKVQWGEVHEICCR